MTSRFASQIRSSLHALGVADSARLLLGVSGGADSISLLVAVSEWSASRILAVYVDHQLREEAKEEKGFVEETAKRLGARFVGRSIDTKALAKTRGLGLEEAARFGRYQAFLGTAQDESISFVGVGHTADDQAETVLWRLLRGGALASLSGMSPRRPLDEGVALVRPMLSVRRSEIEKYLNDRGQAFLEDASNRSLDFTRNRLRQVVLPSLRKENPHLPEALVALSNEVREQSELVSLYALERRKTIVISSNATSVTFSVRGLSRESSAIQAQVVQSALPWGKLSRGQLMSVLRLLISEGGRSVSLRGGLTATRSKDRLVVRWGKDPPDKGDQQ